MNHRPRFWQISTVLAPLPAVLLLMLAAPASAQNVANAAAARLTAAEDAYSSTRMAFLAEQATAEEIYDWSLRLLDANKAANPAGIEAALREHLERMRWLEHEVSQRVARGTMSDSAIYRTGYYLSEALYWMALGGYTP